MSELREAAQAVVDAKDNPLNSIEDIEQVVERLRAALAQPEPEPVVIGPEWTPCVKLPITVHVREQRPDEQHVSTREGITPVKPDDLIMRGVAGEEYPIGRELFEKTYRIGAHPPRDEWRPAGDPPDTTRSVLIWLRFGDVETFGKTLGGPSGFAFQNGAITHWRDIEPPEQEGE